jgi:putative peptidoglycan lipid II flippase
MFKAFKIGSATALVALFSVFSYGIGLFRDRIIANTFGADATTDAYNASFLVPDILFNMFIAAALSAAFLPVFSGYLKKDRKEAENLANTMLTMATLVIGVLAVVAYFMMPDLIPFLYPEESVGLQGAIIDMTRIMLLSAILFAVSNTLGNILMGYKHFFAYAFSPVLYNVGIIAGILLLSDEMGIYAAAYGVVIGAFLHALVRVIDIFCTSYRYRPSLNVSHPGFQKILKLMVPKSISQIAWPVNLYLFSVIGLQLVEGGFTAFNYARNLQSFAVSIFGISFATAVFPFLSEKAAEKDFKGFSEHIRKTVQRVLFFTIPAAVGMMFVSGQIVDLILGGGRFDAQAVAITAPLLFFFALSIPFESLTHILARAFYAMKDTFTPMLVNITSMILIGFCTFYIAPKLGINWFAIGFTLGFVFYVLLISLFLGRKLQQFQFKKMLRSIFKFIVAAACMSLILVLTAEMHVVFRIGFGAGAYFFAAYLLKIEEISSVNYILRRFISKKTS